jgi:ATP-binding cassette subfamily F protein uup
MKTLLKAIGVEKAFGDRHILRGCDLTVHPGQKLGLVGANGCGKSTLLAILGGRAEADLGEVRRQGRLGWLGQVPELTGETVLEAVAEGLAWHTDLKDRWEAAIDAQDLELSGELQEQLDHFGWDLSHELEAVCSRVGCPPAEARLERLSGGEKRRVALARALLGRPEILLLDEPTNHLDADAIEWLQSWLGAYEGALVLVTHDRYLLEAVADRIVEIEMGVCVGYEGSYADYLLTRAERQASLRKGEDRRLSLLAREAEWASRSPAARTTKQKARLDRLDALKASGPLVGRDQDFSLDLRSGVKLGSTVIELHDLAIGFGGRQLFSGLNLSLSPGERLGILGPNGSGKSTLLRIISGRIQPDAGELILGSRVKLAVLDQERSGLPEGVTVWEAAGGGNDHVFIGGKPVHVASFLGRFLFTRQHYDQSVDALSGGERARLLLARLLLQGANLLILDEPTNDLDLQTLRVLEEALLAFDGAALIVTHDRALLDRVSTGVLVFEGDRVQRYADRQQHLKAMAKRSKQASAPRKKTSRDKPKPPARKLSYKEKQQLEALPQEIEQAEGHLAELETALAAPGLYRDRPDEVAVLTRQHTDQQKTIETLYARWTELESRS